MAIKKSSNLREFEEIVVSLKESGKSVTEICLDSAKQTRQSREFREFFHDFLSEVGTVSDDTLDAILLSRVSKRFPVLFDSVKWTWLAGRIEFAMESREKDSGKNLDEAMFSSIVGEFARLEEYAPYLERELKGFVFNKCVDRKLDYMKLRGELKTPGLVKKFLKEYPFCVEAKEWDMLSMAYNMGTKAVIRLQDEKSLENGYIGGEVRFSRYTPVTGGPVIPDGKVTGIGQIDYKDCTNVFAIIDSNRKAVAWYGMTEYQRRSILECVEKSRKLREAQGLVNARGRRKGVNI